MKIKAIWGFRGDAAKLGGGTGRVRAGDTFANVATEYGHSLIGKGLVEEVEGGAEIAADKRPSEGLSVPQLKKALIEKGISIPEGADKAALAALLDQAGAQ
jgi:hypothetical protein